MENFQGGIPPGAEPIFLPWHVLHAGGHTSCMQQFVTSPVQGSVEMTSWSKSRQKSFWNLVSPGEMNCQYIHRAVHLVWH